MNRTMKRILCTVLILIVLVGAVWGGLVLFRTVSKKPVPVYSVSDFSITNDVGDNFETYGPVTTDKLQKVSISETQTVKEIYVQEGQAIQVGDPLLAYDTTLSDIDLEKARIKLSKLELQRKTAETELDKLKQMKPHSSVLITPPSGGISYTPQQTPMLLSGSGTEEDPFYYLWDADAVLDNSILSQMFPAKVPSDGETDDSSVPETDEEQEPEDGSNEEEKMETSQSSEDSTQPGDMEPSEPSEPVSPSESYVVLVVRENNALNGPVLSSFGLHLDNSGNEIRVRLFQPDLPEDMLSYESDPEPYYQESGSDYSASELAQMRGEKEQEIRELTVSIQIAKVELEKLEREVSDGVVRSTIDGTVKVVRNPDEAYKNNQPVVEVSAGGGYYITGTMSELDLNNIAVGQTVEVNSYMTGTLCEGTIVDISTYPTAEANFFSSDTNSNVSYYPFRVFVDESAELQEDDFVNMTYQSQSQEDSLYLENQFLRTENGRSYVYVRNEAGVLEKRTVQIGRDLYGSYTQILSGLTTEDYVAFPYGNDVMEGAKTSESTSDAFYNN